MAEKGAVGQTIGRIPPLLREGEKKKVNIRREMAGTEHEKSRRFSLLSYRG